MPRFNHPPLARHEALVPLSRDHYTGLVQVRHLRQSARQDAVARRRAVSVFIDAWQAEIAVHFADEERLLETLLSPQDAERLHQEHQQLGELAAAVRAEHRAVDPDAQKISAMADALEAHIRWEERELFPRVQASLDDAQLQQLHEATARMEASRPRCAVRATRLHEGNLSRDPGVSQDP